MRAEEIDTCIAQHLDRDKLFSEHVLKLERENETFYAQLDSLKKENESLKTLLSHLLDTRIDITNDETIALLYADLKVDYEKSDSENTVLRAHNDKLKKDVAILQASLNKLQSDLEVKNLNFETEISVTKLLLDKKMDEYQKSETNLTQMQLDCDKLCLSYRERIDRLVSDNNECKSKIARSDQLCNKHLTELMEFKRYKENMEKKYQDLQDTLIYSEDQRKIAQEQVLRNRPNNIRTYGSVKSCSSKLFYSRPQIKPNNTNFRPLNVNSRMSVSSFTSTDINNETAVSSSIVHNLNDDLPANYNTHQDGSFRSKRSRSNIISSIEPMIDVTLPGGLEETARAGSSKEASTLNIAVSSNEILEGHEEDMNLDRLEEYLDLRPVKNLYSVKKKIAPRKLFDPDGDHYQNLL